MSILSYPYPPKGPQCQWHKVSRQVVNALSTLVTTVLADLHVQHCNDFFSVGNGAWSAISCVKSLRRLAIEDLHCRLDADSLKELATMPQVSPCFYTTRWSLCLYAQR